MILQNPDAQWLVSLVPYEGTIVALRAKPLDEIVGHKERCPILAILSHELAEVGPNGLPTSIYNDSLASFDKDVLFLLSQVGTAAIVETCSGKRNYYGYVANEESLREAFKNLGMKYPVHSLTLRFDNDPDWQFYSQYRSLFRW
jgi:hypothetical protein